jgi:hypothetical protein
MVSAPFEQRKWGGIPQVVIIDEIENRGMKLLIAKVIPKRTMRPAEELVPI